MVTDTERPQRKRIRLPRDAYAQPDATWLISIAVKDRDDAPLADARLGRDILTTLLDAAEGRLEVFVVVVMPDHVHLLVAVVNGNLSTTCRR